MPNENAPLYGLVLCGGESTRMKQEKGLLVTGGKTWALRTADLLAPFVRNVWLSIRNNQEEEYRVVIPEASFIADEDHPQLFGPLTGLISANRQFPGADWLVLACDLPALTSRTLQQLPEALRQNPGYDAYAFFHPQSGQFEPLVAIYCQSFLHKVCELLKTSAEPAPGLQKLLRLHKTFSLPVDTELLQELTNANDPQTARPWL
ncbi:NTP transferase domain-containing protein [Flavihumibacter petaseus]|uniref:Probable molybdenum cofactor guanylyltransferase n=1 Tax=Flavihumibacter petaseus NBRC 106054 TaxID=1220578 RepID=A0A0E9N542_9BACT|nr:NTP transferase domain-containing protein [Flavihumibacter petaseus]GAO44821.1 molybdenum cofactor guanylyltransferase [Flavihumibacter petaseus NBRC 106054]